MSRIAPPAVRHLYDDALALLLGWHAPDESQEQLRRSFLSALASDPMSVSREGPPVHLTASCLVLDPDARSVLLHLHRRARIWMQFGGHLDAGDVSVLGASAREAREESGIPGIEPIADPVDLDRHQLVGDFGGCVEHLDVRFLALLSADVMPRASEESIDIGWFPIDALPANHASDLPRLISVARTHAS